MTVSQAGSKAMSKEYKPSFEKQPVLKGVVVAEKQFCFLF